MSALTPIPSYANKAKNLLYKVGLASFLVRSINDSAKANTAVTLNNCALWAGEDNDSKYIIVDYPANSSTGRAQMRFHVIGDPPSLLQQTLTTKQLQAIERCISMK